MIAAHLMWANPANFELICAGAFFAITGGLVLWRFQSSTLGKVVGAILVILSCASLLAGCFAE
jgi:hypothetical protein